MILQPKHCTDGLLEIGLDESSPSLRARETSLPGGVPERACAVGPREVVGEKRGLAIPVRIRHRAYVFWFLLSFFLQSWGGFLRTGTIDLNRSTLSLHS